MQFVGINTNRQDSLEEIGHCAREHKIEFPLLKDRGNRERTGYYLNSVLHVD